MAEFEVIVGASPRIQSALTILNTAVREKLADGWQLVGGVNLVVVPNSLLHQYSPQLTVDADVLSFVYSQGMVKYGSDSNGVDASGHRVGSI